MRKMPRLNLKNKRMASTKRTLKIIGTILGCILLFLLIGTRIKKVPCVPEVPLRTGEVPLSARWIGGCDGGHWFDVTEMNSEQNRYYISIYHDYNG